MRNLFLLLSFGLASCAIFSGPSVSEKNVSIYMDSMGTLGPDYYANAKLCSDGDLDNDFVKVACFRACEIIKDAGKVRMDCVQKLDVSDEGVQAAVKTHFQLFEAAFK